MISGVFIDNRGGNPSGSRGSRRDIFIECHGPGEGRECYCICCLWIHHVIDSQVFPGRPKSTLNTRSQQTLHPFSSLHGITEVKARSDIIDNFFCKCDSNRGAFIIAVIYSKCDVVSVA